MKTIEPLKITGNITFAHRLQAGDAVVIHASVRQRSRGDHDIRLRVDENGYFSGRLNIDAAEGGEISFKVFRNSRLVLEAAADPIRFEDSQLEVTLKVPEEHDPRSRLQEIGRFTRVDPERFEAIRQQLPDIQQIDLTTLVDQDLVNEYEIEDIRLGATLRELTGGNERIAGALLGCLPYDESRASRPVADLAQLSRDDWRNALATNMDELPEDADLDLLTDEIMDRFDAAHPTETLFERFVVPTMGTVLESDILGADNTDLRRLETAFAPLNLGETLTNDQLGDDEKRVRIRHQLGLVNTFYDRNPGFNLITSDLMGDAGDLVWGDISEEDRRDVRATLKGIQRVRRVAPSSESTWNLLGSGYDSALKIAREPVGTFSEKTGLSAEISTWIHGRARDRARGSLNTALMLVDLHYNFDFTFGHYNLGPDLQDTLKDYAGYQDLFGSQNYCRCAHCDSILSPAAYFVDLMRFIEEHVSNTHFTGATEDHLLAIKTRRPDLWTLPLTCEYTSTQVSYLEVVIGVLEAYLADRLSIDVDDVYERLSTSDDSFQQPFHISQSALLVLLKHFDVTLLDVAEVLNVDATVRTRLALDASPVEFSLIAQPDTEIAFLKRLYGDFLTFNSGTAEPVNLLDLLEPMGVDRDEIATLIETGFVQEATAVSMEPKKLTAESFQNDAEFVVGLTPEALDRMHRFARLRRHTGWLTTELDLVLETVGFDLEEVTRLRRLQIRLGIRDVRDVVTLVAELPESRLDERFNLPDFVHSEGRLPSNSPEFLHPSFKDDPAQSSDDPQVHRLLAALRISATELLHLITWLVDPLGITDTERSFPLDARNLSLLYRHALAARALDFSIEELFVALDLIGATTIGKLAHIESLLKLSDWTDEHDLDVLEAAALTRPIEDWNEEASAVVQTVINSVTSEGLLDKAPDVGLLLRNHLISALVLEAEQVGALLDLAQIDLSDTAFHSDVASGTIDGVFSEQIARMVPLKLIAEHFEFSADAISFLAQHHQAFGISVQDPLEWGTIQSIGLFRILLEAGIHEDRLGTVLAGGLQQPASEVKEALAEWLDLEGSEIEMMLSNVVLEQDSLKAVGRLHAVAKLMRDLGLNAEGLRRMTSDDFDELGKARNAVLGAIRARFDTEDAWEKSYTPLRDEIINRKCDGLADYLINSVHPEFDDRESLYYYFLLDTEMDGCTRTSMLLAAISSLQFYVHRCLMNLEQSRDEQIHVLPTSIPRDEWAWRRNYRLWEANRKVFLYPENYIEPELRDNKSPLFRKLESSLLQTEVTKDSVATAYREYLSELIDIANLKIAGSYHSDDVVFLVGRTEKEPTRFFLRAHDLNREEWSAWREIDLPIQSRYLSPILYIGVLYLFWIEVATNPRFGTRNGENEFVGYTHRVSIKFTYQLANGRWQKPQTIPFPPQQPDDAPGLISDPLLDFPDLFQPTVTLIKRPRYDFENWHPEPDESYTLTGTDWERIYPFVSKDGRLCMVLENYGLDVHPDGPDSPQTRFYEIKVENRTIKALDDEPQALRPLGTVMVPRLWQSRIHQNSVVPIGLNGTNSNTYYLKSTHFSRQIIPPDLAIQVGLGVGLADLDGRFHSINNLPREYVINFDDDSYLMLRNLEGTSGEYKAIRLTSSIVQKLKTVLFEEGLTELLSLKRQVETEENDFQIEPVEFGILDKKIQRFELTDAYGLYYRELFFHIPFLIANHLNATQRFEEARRWYQYIFDPTAFDDRVKEKSIEYYPFDYAWKYIGFRFKAIEKLKEILSDQAAIEAYHKDPFNPHAIARLRLNAYQKTIVMKYVDNLLDWADHLFARDTVESINEATMLYQMAHDILGKRPAQLGPCEIGETTNRTYANLKGVVGSESEFLYELENAVLVPRALTMTTAGSSAEPSSVASAAPSGDGVSAFSTGMAIMAVGNNAWEHVTVKREGPWSSIDADGGFRIPYELVTQSLPAFCVSPNRNLFGLWDRVEDRLFKIRHCMDIKGVRRRLALFQPPIDPALLVRAVAAGISLDEVLDAITGTTPPFRFAILVEKAKQYTAIVQSLGSSLLGALSRKDAEELLQLNSTHQQNILRLTTEVKRKRIEQIEQETRANNIRLHSAETRQRHYESLIDVGLSVKEVAQQTARDKATDHRSTQNFFSVSSSLAFLIPQAGSLVEQKFGGQQLGQSLAQVATIFGGMAALEEAKSTSAGLESSFSRRRQGWVHQTELATFDVRHLQRQVVILDIRKAILERDLEIHEQTMEQAAEVFDFYREKFTGKNLQTWMIQELQLLYRQAYNLAFETAIDAQSGHNFERNDTADIVRSGHWDGQRAGLLAGDKLQVQLQQLDRRHLEQTEREYEITQTFSLARINPEALLSLRKTGTCTFKIPEVMFDLQYPGQYRRRIKAVKMTMPCVTGAFTNVGAKLSLLNSQIRWEPQQDTDQQSFLEDVAWGKSSVVTSSGKSDGGVFQLSMGDPRYLPFEGAGAISEWRLSLPDKFRGFDYRTITDVILHLSYTSSDDEVFRNQVETGLADAMNELARSVGLGAMFSLKQDFSNEFHRLINSPLGTSVDLKLTRRHFAYFLRDKQLEITSGSVVLELADLDGTVGSFTLKLKGQTVDGFSSSPDFGGLFAKAITTQVANQDPVQIWALQIDNAGDLAGDADQIDPDKIRDVYLVLHFGVSE